MEMIEELELNINPKIIRLKLIIKDLDSLKEKYEEELRKGMSHYECTEAYHKWFVKSNTFFRNYFPDDDEDLIAFTNVDIEQDGYGLAQSYIAQRYAYNNLISKIETHISSCGTSNKTNDMPANKKIFISHSSLDSAIIDQFVDKILKLGLSFLSEDIACTSRNDTGVKTGKDIRDFIKQNISKADFVFFMISDNYKNSEICLNEMGAAWATDRDVKIILLPNVNFESIGWLYNVNKGISLKDSSSLDLLAEDICEKYGNKLKVTSWNKHKEEFIRYIDGFNDKKLTTEAQVLYEEVEELDLLDCREIFDEDIELNVKSLQIVTNALTLSAEETNKSAKHIENINQNVNSSPAQVRNILLKLAYENNKLAEVYEKEAPAIRTHFEKAINAAIKMRELAELEGENIVTERLSIRQLIEGMEGFMSATESARVALEADNNRLDKTHNKSKNRLINCFNSMIDTIRYCIEKAHELLIYTC